MDADLGFVKRLNALCDRSAVQEFAKSVCSRASRTFDDDPEFKAEAKKLAENMPMIAEYLSDDWVKTHARFC